jgi:hypothetical protein
MAWILCPPPFICLKSFIFDIDVKFMGSKEHLNAPRDESDQPLFCPATHVRAHAPSGTFPFLPPSQCLFSHLLPSIERYFYQLYASAPGRAL